ncbi:hypothetical protein F5I97DRAFT_1802922 [Phlebopus sp. FC_14]|nr:hypothetical protein F5I97DRAFT_1802922 [Phlebopus sp. FC_14]
MLLRPPSRSTLSHVPDFPPSFDPTSDQDFTFNTRPADDLRSVREFAELLRSDKVQEALRAARESEAADKSELGISFRRQGRKRKRSVSPVGSPQPYVPPPPRSSSLFSPPEDDPLPLRVESLVQFVRDFNHGEFKHAFTAEADGIPPSSKCKLAIWSRTKMLQDELKALEETPSSSGSGRLVAAKLPNPTVLRFMIPDILFTYISLIVTSAEDPIQVESVTAFGPREKKLPHQRSDYQVFQMLSQHIAKMLQSYPRVPLQILVSLLVSYRGLFVEQCTSCRRVLSQEGHIPPVARVWTPKERPAPSVNAIECKQPNADGGTSGPPVPSEPVNDDVADHGSGHWEPRHAACLYN